MLYVVCEKEWGKWLSRELTLKKSVCFFLIYQILYITINQDKFFLFFKVILFVHFLDMSSVKAYFI